MPVTAIMKHLGDGRFECIFDDQRQECVAKFPEGENAKAALTLPRSLPHHNFFFQKIAKLWESLPETEDRFPNPERLRKYLLVRAGHRDQQFWPLEHVDQLSHMFKQFGLFSGELFFAPKPNGIIAMRAKTINHDECDQATFLEIDRKVDQIIAREFGIATDDLMERAA